MEVAVKWLYDRHEQNETALAIRGRKRVSYVVHDQPVRVYTTPTVIFIRDENQRVISQRDTWNGLKDVTKAGKPYPVLDCARHFLEVGKKKGITEAARKLLEAVVDGKHVPEDEIDTRPSENVVSSPAEPKKRRERCSAETADAQKESPKSKKSPKESRNSATAPATGRGTLIARICADLELEPRVARKLLRKAGLRAPYKDEAAIRKALSKS